jgi:hypothetical protein
MAGKIFLGLPLFAWGGLLVGLLVVFQILNGLRIIRVKPKCHKITAFSILALAAVHGIVSLATWFGWF